jgi:hypothetical protein
MKANIKVVVSNGMTGEVTFSEVLTARGAEVFTNNLLEYGKFAIATLTQIDSGQVIKQTGKSGTLSVPVCRADYPAFEVHIRTL